MRATSDAPACGEQAILRALFGLFSVPRKEIISANCECTAKSGCATNARRIWSRALLAYAEAARLHCWSAETLKNR